MGRWIWVLRKVKVRTRIALLLTSLLLISFLLVIGVLSAYIRSTIHNNVYDYLLSTQNQAADSIEVFIDEIIMQSLRIRTNQELYNVVLSGDLSEIEKNKHITEILDDIFSGYGSTSVAGVQLVTKDGICYTSCYPGLTFSKPSDDLLSQIRGTVYYVCDDPVVDYQGNQYIPIGLVCNAYHTGRRVGELILYIRASSLQECFNNMSADIGYSYIVDHKTGSYCVSDQDVPEEADLVSRETDSRQTPYINIMDLNGSRYVVAIQELSRRMQNIGFEWQIISIVPYHQLFSAEKQIRNTLLLMGIGMLGVAIMTTLKLSTRLTESLKKLRGKLMELAGGNLDALIDQEPRDEIWELENSYNEMAVRIKELIQKSLESKDREREMEFTALQAQINPHFLYNTLDALGWIARIKKQDEIEHMVLELANFFRMSLHKGDRLISVEDEIQLVKSFATIEQMRNPDKFNISYSVDESVAKELIPKIILQPVVENAIKHGVYELRRKGNIEVRVYRDGQDIFMEVEDDGKGFDTTEVQFKSYDHLKHSGYGLRNVAERITLEYGPGYGLDVRSEPGCTVVQLKLRMKSAELGTVTTNE